VRWVIERIALLYAMKISANTSSCFMSNFLSSFLQWYFMNLWISRRLLEWRHLQLHIVLPTKVLEQVWRKFRPLVAHYFFWHSEKCHTFYNGADYINTIYIWNCIFPRKTREFAYDSQYMFLVDKVQIYVYNWHRSVRRLRNAVCSYRTLLIVCAIYGFICGKYTVLLKCVSVSSARLWLLFWWYSLIPFPCSFSKI